MFVATLLLLVGIFGMFAAENRWTASAAHCPPPRPNEVCLVVKTEAGWALSAWSDLGVGLGGLAVGASLILLAERVRRRRQAVQIGG